MSSPVAAPPAAPPPASPSAMTAVLFATAPGGPDGLPAAAWPWEPEATAGGEPAGRGRTLVERLASQLASLGVRDLHVVVRPGQEPAASGGALSRAHVQVSPDAAADLRFVAAIARGGDGTLVLAGAEIVTQREALAGLLADPRVATGILATSGRIARPYGYRTKTRRGRIVSAASPFHTTADPNQTFLGVLKVAPVDRLRLAELADQLAVLRAAPPDEWRRELEFCKAGTWKLAAERIRRTAVERDALLAGEASEGPEDDPEAEGDPEASDEAPADVERQNPAGIELSPADAAELERRMAAAAEEVPALLLVALVRDGAQVANSFLRSLFWARPLTEEAVLAARERIAAHDEEAELLRSAVKASDGFFTTFFVSPVSKYVARWCSGRFTPNQITTLSLVIGILAAGAFATGERAGLITGAVLAYFAFFLDCVDGQLARYSRTFSKLGAWLDSIFDRTKEYALFAGLAIGASQMGEPAWVLACAALALQTTRHAVDFSYPTTQHQVIAVLPHAPLERPGDGFGLNTPLWLRPPPLPKDQRPPPPPVSLSRRAFRRWRRMGRGRRATWVRKAITFPIGERFAVISLVTAIFSPRTTFIVLLAWGGFAAAYIVAGRLLRVVRSAAAVAPPGSVRGRLEAYRDDGPLARALRVPLPVWPVALIAAGLLPLVLAIVLESDDASNGLAAAVIVWLVLLSALSANLPHYDRLRWLVPPGLRAAEFIGVTWMATLDSPAAVPAAFGFLCAVCFREYDLVYRLRHRGTEAGPLVANLGLGWDGRLLLVLVLLVAGLLPTGLWVAGALLLTLFVVDAVHAWTSFGRAPKAPVYADEEEENE